MTRSYHFVGYFLLLMALGWGATTAAAQTCPHGVDVIQDGSLTPADALRASRHFLGIADLPLHTCEQAQANVDEPQTSGITPADALCIFQAFLGLPSCLPRAVGLALVATGLSQPVFVMHAGDDRLFIVPRLRTPQIIPAHNLCNGGEVREVVRNGCLK